MKLSRRDPYRPRRHPIVKLGWLLLIALILLLCFFWWRGGERPMERMEVPVSAEQLRG